jgi:hypothetical protein
VKELCDLLASLEVASPGTGKAIASLLTGKPTRGDIKKLEKSLRSKGKKCGVFGKASVAA